MPETELLRRRLAWTTARARDTDDGARLDRDRAAGAEDRLERAPVDRARVRDSEVLAEAGQVEEQRRARAEPLAAVRLWFPRRDRAGRLAMCRGQVLDELSFVDST
jgi:hypothetical protein